jgi:hypothetical protein
LQFQNPSAKRPCVRIEKSSAANCLLLALLLLGAAFGLSACGSGDKSVSAAKKALGAKSNDASTTESQAMAGADTLGSERYLPREERLRRRQQRILDVLNAQPPAPTTK